MTTNASHYVPTATESSEWALSTSSLPVRTDLPAGSNPFVRRNGYRGRIPSFVAYTWLSRRMTYTQDYLRHGSSTTMVLDQPETSMLSETDELSEETLPLIAHRRYQISATLNFKGHAEIILLGGDETLEE